MAAFFCQQVLKFQGLIFLNSAAMAAFFMPTSSQTPRADFLNSVAMAASLTFANSSVLLAFDCETTVCMI